MANFVRVASLADVRKAGKLLAEVEDRLVVLIQSGNEVTCIDDVCTHDGGPLSDGRVEGNTIACPRHGAQFDICTGEAVTMPATEDTASHDVMIQEDAVWVKINE